MNTTTTAAAGADGGGKPAGCTIRPHPDTFRLADAVPTRPVVGPDPLIDCRAECAAHDAWVDATRHRRSMAAYVGIQVAMAVVCGAMGTYLRHAGNPPGEAGAWTIAAGATAFAVSLFPAYRRAVRRERAAEQAHRAALDVLCGGEGVAS
jgi:hypothetical protein